MDKMVYYAINGDKVFFASFYFDTVQLFTDNATDILLYTIAEKYHLDINDPVEYERIKSYSISEYPEFKIYSVFLNTLLQNKQIQSPEGYINSNEILDELYND